MPDREQGSDVCSPYSFQDSALRGSLCAPLPSLTPALSSLVRIWKVVGGLAQGALSQRALPSVIKAMFPTTRHCRN